jgi:hypothetical protein
VPGKTSKQWDNPPVPIPAVTQQQTIAEFLQVRSKVKEAKALEVKVEGKKQKFNFPSVATIWCADIGITEDSLLQTLFLKKLPKVQLLMSSVINIFIGTAIQR